MHEQSTNHISLKVGMHDCVQHIIHFFLKGEVLSERQCMLSHIMTRKSSLGKFCWFSWFTMVSPAASNTWWNLSTLLKQRGNIKERENNRSIVIMVITVEKETASVHDA